MKTYILKLSVNNGHNCYFPIGTVVKITDDYWPGSNTENTGFTVVEGELKDKKGCVGNGLKGYLIEDTPENRKILSELSEQIKLAKANIKLAISKIKAIPHVPLN